MTKFSNHKARRGFTLIELLIVIGLLGALTALVLPSMMADREEALADICDYNQAGTLRVLKQYQQITGKLPNLMHAGLTEGDEPMPGLPAPQVININMSASHHELTSSEASALQAAGISLIAKGEGLNPVNVATGVQVLNVLPEWRDDADAEFSFYGKSVSDYNDDATRIFAFYVTPTIDWEAAEGGNKDWTKGNVKLSLDLEGKCPIPAGSDFSYYVAYVAVASDYYDVSQSGSGDLAPTFSLNPSKFLDESAAQAAVEEAVEANDDFENWAGPWSAGVRVASFSDGEATPTTGTVTFTINDRTGTGEAKLVGTSCPECGILNP